MTASWGQLVLLWPCCRQTEQRLRIATGAEGASAQDRGVATGDSGAGVIACNVCVEMQLGTPLGSKFCLDTVKNRNGRKNPT